jgi:uncharacterized FAD-dependent dehydrogenase
MIRINQIKIFHDINAEISHDELSRILKKKAAKLLRVSENDIKDFEIIRHSIDARKKPEIFDIYMVDLRLKGGSEEQIVKKSRDKNASVIADKKYDFWKQALNSDDKEGLIKKASACDKKIVVIGAGPSGLFCAYELARNGFKPLLLERGAAVEKRMELVNKFWETGVLDTRTNVQFGEGGAGTFSDGKLNTMVKDKDGRGRYALSVFTVNGANKNIMYEAKPHIGTDILCDVVRNMRNRIIELGGEVRFETQVTDISFEQGRVTAVMTGDEVIPADAVVLAIGHSARDTFYMLKDRAVDMQPKPFAVGYRVEHRQNLINFSQYGVEEPGSLGAAPYKLVANTREGRGVYSFCMCPGGFVVNASSEEGRLAINGMSYNKRDGANANSAIIITVDPKDFGSEDVLSGVEFQRRLEEKAYELGGGKIPVEYFIDFKAQVQGGEPSDIDRSSFNRPQMRGDYVFAKVHEILPDELNQAFIEGMEKFGHTIKGYDNDDALISGVESRTSSPVRINRDEKGESLNVKGLYPCGEGAGYAGGIMSAAMDGLRTAELIAGNLLG